MNINERTELASKVFEKYGHLIQAIIAHNVKDQSIADDIYQEVYLDIVLKPIPAEVNMEAYLYKLVINDIIDAARRAKGYRDRIRRYRRRGDCKVMHQSHEMTTMQLEEAQIMISLMEELLESYEARAVMRRYYYGNNIAEGARSMGIKKKTFSHYLCVGLAKIREYFAQSERNNDVSS